MALDTLPQDEVPDAIQSELDPRNHRSLVDDEILPFITDVSVPMVGPVASLWAEALEFGDLEMLGQMKHILQLRTAIKGKRAQMLAEALPHDDIPEVTDEGRSRRGWGL